MVTDILLCYYYTAVGSGVQGEKEQNNSSRVIVSGRYHHQNPIPYGFRFDYQILFVVS